MMMFAARLLAFLLFVLAARRAQGVAAITKMDVVVRGGDPWIEGMDEGEFPTYRNGACTVRFPRDGNWATQNGYNTGGWDANQNSLCQSLSATTTAGGGMKYKLQRDGNFVAYCGYYLDYATHTGQRQEGDYFMAIDDSCILHIFRGTFDCDSVSIEEEIWTNVRRSPLRNGDRLGKGEMVRHDEDGEDATLVMQSSDGNLVLYAGDGAVLWAANQEWDGPPPSRFHDFYAKVTDSGYLKLVGIDYQYGEETVYFAKKLAGGGGGCFTVEYDGALSNDLVAVPC